MKLVVVLLLVLATPAFAEPSANDRSAAERYFRAGAKAYSAQNFSAAAVDFDEAYKAMPLPEIAFSAAQAYRRLYRVEPKPDYVRRSVELYRVYLDKVKTGGRVGDAADSLGEMERELDRLKIKLEVSAPVVDKTRLGVSVTISGESAATLHEIGDVASEKITGLAATLDGKPIEPFALVDVDAREHVLAVTAAGYLPVEKKAMAVTGQSQLIEIELKPKPAVLAVTTEPGARISVDGRALATAPAGTLELAPGKHLLAITHRGREPFGRELLATHGQTLAVDAPLEMTGRRRALPWVLTGAGIAGAGAIATGIVALVRDSHASDLQAAIAMGNQPQKVADEYDRTVSSRDHFVTATWILGGAAVAAGATGVLLWMFDEPSAEGLHVVPVATSGGAGAFVSGRF
jgi:PEGA domain-containing protein